MWPTAQNRFGLQPPAVFQNTTSDVLECISRSEFSNSPNHLKTGTWARGCKNTFVWEVNLQVTQYRHSLEQAIIPNINLSVNHYAVSFHLLIFIDLHLALGKRGDTGVYGTRQNKHTIHYNIHNICKVCVIVISAY